MWLLLSHDDDEDDGVRSSIKDESVRSWLDENGWTDGGVLTRDDFNHKPWFVGDGPDPPTVVQDRPGRAKTTEGTDARISPPSPR